MSDALIMLLIGNVISIGLFLIGLRFNRMKELPTKNYQGPDSIEGLNKLGKIFMMVAPIFMIFWNLMMFGFLGPIEGVTTF